MAVNCLGLEDTDFQGIVVDRSGLFPSAGSSRAIAEYLVPELPENSHFPPITRTPNPLESNTRKSCCICLIPLALEDQSSEAESFEFGYVSEQSNVVDVIDGGKIFKILDINPLNMQDNAGYEKEKAVSFPICRPCYIEVIKFEKLQAEIQRIVDQIVTTVLENLEFRKGMVEDGPLASGSDSLGVDDLLNPMEALRDLIFERWKPLQFSESRNQTPNHSSSRSSIFKSIFGTLQLPEEEIVSNQDRGIIGNSSSTTLSSSCQPNIDVGLENRTDESHPKSDTKSNDDQVQTSPFCDNNIASSISDLRKSINHSPEEPRSRGYGDFLNISSPNNASVNDLDAVPPDDTISEGSLNPDRRGPFICHKCRKEFRQQRDLDVHNRRQHTKERPFICDICFKSYPAKSALHHHRKIHSQRFVCDICGAAVVTETGLKKHMQIHSGIKPFVCEICSKAFMWKQSLLKHQVLHTDSRPFSCRICNRSFPLKNYLDKHMGRRHPDNGEGQVAVLECPYCETKTMKFRTPGNLSAHILRKHSSASASFV